MTITRNIVTGAGDGGATGAAARRRPRFTWKDAVFYGIVALTLVVILYPVAWMILSTFKPSAQIVGNADLYAGPALARALADRHGFAGQQRFVDIRVAFEHLPVHRHLVAWAHAQPVARMHGIERDLLVAAVCAQAARDRRREA